MVKVKFKTEGMKELQKSFEKLGKVPQKYVTSAARKGMNIPLKKARSDAPVGETGNLKRGIVLKGEKSRYKAKKVFRIVFDAKMNDVFQKPIKNPIRAKSNPAYYPASMEYGFFDKKGVYHQSSHRTGWIVGFVHSGLTYNVITIEKTIIRTMKSKMDAELRKAGLK